MNGLWETLYGWYLQIWPNLAASAICLPVGFAWHHRKMLRRMAEHHEETRQYVTQALNAAQEGADRG